MQRRFQVSNLTFCGGLLFAAVLVEISSKGLHDQTPEFVAVETHASAPSLTTYTPTHEHLLRVESFDCRNLKACALPA